MIGYVFPTSGAVVLAMAPAKRSGDYIVLAQTDAPGTFAVATLDARHTVETNGAPERWLHADYLPRLPDAVEDFARDTGLTYDAVAGHVDHVRHLLAERV